MTKARSNTQKHPNEDSRGMLTVSAVMPEVYDELRALARRYIGRERAPQTLQATALVNEAYLRLKKEKNPSWKNRAHFCAIAAHSMREILVEKARARAASKRGGSRVRVSLENCMAAGDDNSTDIIALHEALSRLADVDPQLARLVELRFFGGLTIEESADALGASTTAIKRGWKFAKAWLLRELEKFREP
jgi:RNA polymerase sigma factor (TIGR02999 family)